MEVASSIINAGLHCPNPTGEPVGRAAARQAPSRVRGAVQCNVQGVQLQAMCSSVCASRECAESSGVARACRARGMGSGRTGGVTFQRGRPGVAWFVRAGGVARGVAWDIDSHLFSTYKRFLERDLKPPGKHTVDEMHCSMSTQHDTRMARKET